MVLTRHQVLELLEKEEKRYGRLASLPYNSPFRALLTFKLTMLPLALVRWEVWVFLGIHIVLKCLLLFNVVDRPLWEEVLSTAPVEAGGSIPLSFFGGIALMAITFMVLSLVFFAQESYTRYTLFYENCMRMQFQVQQASQQAVTHIRKDKQTRWDACRYLLASALLVYMKVTEPPSMAAQIDEDEWLRLEKTEAEYKKKEVRLNGHLVRCPPLLSREEALLLRGYGGNRTVLLQTWALRVLRDGFADEGAKSSDYAAVEKTVLGLREACENVVTQLAFPLPFPYYHLLVVLMMLTYTLLAVAFALYDSVVTPIAMFLIVIVCTGIREVSCALSNPFGKDVIDFTVQKYMSDLRSLVSATALVADSSLPDTSEPMYTEHQLEHTGAQLAPLPPHMLPPHMQPRHEGVIN